MLQPLNPDQKNAIRGKWAADQLNRGKPAFFEANMRGSSGHAMASLNTECSTQMTALPHITGLDPEAAASIQGGARRGNPSRVSPDGVGRVRPGRVPMVSAAMYQINIAFNFILGGNNNSISTVQGNGIEGMQILALGPR